MYKIERIHFCWREHWNRLRCSTQICSRAYRFTIISVLFSHMARTSPLMNSLRLTGIISECCRQSWGVVGHLLWQAAAPRAWLRLCRVWIDLSCWSRFGSTWWVQLSRAAHAKKHSKQVWNFNCEAISVLPNFLLNQSFWLHLDLVCARYGGAIFQDTCMDSKECSYLGISSSAGASTVLFDSNLAGFHSICSFINGLATALKNLDWTRYPSIFICCEDVN